MHVNERALSNDLRLRLPRPQGVALAILEAVQNIHTSQDDIAVLVASDPVLSQRLLALVNTCATPHHVLTVRHIVAQFGLQTIKNLAIGFSLVDHYSAGACSNFDHRKFWSESLLMALCMRELASQVHAGSAEELFAWAFFARIGCLGLATAYPLEYGQVVDSGLSGQALLQHEESVMGIHHLDLSAAMLTDWGFPDLVLGPVLQHEEAASADMASHPVQGLVVQALHLSHQVATQACGPSLAERGRRTSPQANGEAFHLSASDLAALVDRAVAQSQLWAGLLKIDLLDFAAVLPPVTATAAPTVHTGSRLRILIVEDDPIARTLLLTWLKVDGGHRLYTASNGEEAMDLALRYSPQIIITDWRMPVMNGLELCKNLRLSDWGRSIYVLMLTAADEEEDLVTAFEAGVDDYLTKPLKRPALGARLKAAWRYVQLRETWMRDNERLARVAADLELSNRRHQLASLTDTLTGLPNRRAGQSSLTQAISAAQRYGKQLCVISIDIDHFKHINDRYGHGGGDEVLQLIGNTIQHVARVEDTVCRWGGEEFLIVAPNISLEEGIAAAHRFRRFVESLAISVDVHSISVTISLGVACLDVDSKTRDRLLIEADQALYEAKLAGRNRVAVMDNFGNAIVC